MKKVFALFIGVLLIASCEQDNIVPENEEIKIEQSTLEKKGNKVNVCHYDEENNTWLLINISANAWPAHEAHGDVLLTDADGDSFYPDNECGIGPMGDCDDTNPDVYPGAPEICDDVDNNCDGLLFDRSASASYDGQTFIAGFAYFGTAGTVSGEFVHYDAETGCIPIQDDLSGKIALIDRGSCYFNQKALNAQNAGAKGVIICNYNDYILFMTPGLPDEITIPVIILGLSDCQTISNGGGIVSFTVEDTCVDSDAISTSNIKSKRSNTPTGFNTVEKVTQ